MGELGALAIDWAEWTQAVAAICAVLSVPEVVKRLWRRFDHGMTIMPHAKAPQSQNWKVGVEANHEINVPVSVFFFGAEPNVPITSYRVAYGSGSGVSLALDAQDNGDLLLKIDRMPKDRVIIIEMKFASETSPKFLAVGFRAKQGKWSEDKIDKVHEFSERIPLIQLTHGRIVLLIVQFITITLIICAKMLYIGLNP